MVRNNVLSKERTIEKTLKIKAEVFYERYVYHIDPENFVCLDGTGKQVSKNIY